MKKVSRRALFALALAIVLAAGTLAFCVKYAVNADKWVTFSGSPHVYTGTNLTGGKIYDRTGARILNTTDGRVYSSDAAVRAATVHLLGDRYGYISAPLLGNFAEQMIGYDKITGLSEASKGTASARLTISADVQKAALQALGSYHGTVGVYNYKTGEILCAVTSPSYDPDNIPDIAGDETGDYDGVYLNRFFDAAYTPGSIFKLVTSAAALEADAASKDQTYTCTGETIIGGQEIICMGEHGTLSMTQARARLLLRFGFNMPYSFMPNRIDSSDGNDVQWRPTDASPDWHLFAYGGGAARFVGYDITLDGNTYRGGSSVVPKWLVGEALAGISARYKFFQADLNWTLRSAEFNTQKHPVHMFWTLSLKGYF